MRLLKRLALAVHRGGARLGVHVLPVHYYSSVADLRELERTRPLWARRSELPGIAVDRPGQCVRLREICLPYQAEYTGNAAYRGGVAGGFGPGYGYIEAQALHAIVRHHRPRRIIEVGSGVSTHCMLHALRQNVADGHAASHLTCIEPHPSAPLKALASEGAIELLAEPVQGVAMARFEALEAGDLCFIDSTHAVKPGSDVNHLILEVLPRLRAGVIVHFHDIYLPYDYPRDVLRTLYHWQETALLRAFLIGNAGVRILFSLSQLHYDEPETLREVFPEYVPQGDVDGMATEPGGHFPASTYLRMG